MKKLAMAVVGKAAQMMKPAEAERVTGFKVGGISPFGQRRPVKSVIEQSALAHDHVYVDGGQRGLQVRLSPRRAGRSAGDRGRRDRLSRAPPVDNCTATKRIRLG